MRHLLLGATGLVGRELLQQLLADDATSRLVTITRRPLGLTHPKLESHVFDLGAMEKHAPLFAVDAIFCALGTTIKVAGSQERFRHVDHGLPLLAARLGREHAASHYLLVSALGANARSRVFYNRVKGETENDIRALGYPRFTIARPSLLLGPREEYRRGERIAAKLGWLMPPSMKPIEARDVARALVSAAKEGREGVRVLESKEMRCAPSSS
ncbi:MAG TPA: NAD(P)H-binding protein [Thermoanaerobaculia bacterium]|nr:NAD(P)H-binding protein [Thermoanaerobaculia bacterium]